MRVSSIETSQAGKRRHRATFATEMTGMCLKCGNRITLCGRPFTAEIECNKCHYINSFNNSQQPAGGRESQ